MVPAKDIKQQTKSMYRGGDHGPYGEENKLRLHGHGYQWEIRNYYQQDTHFGNGWGITILSHYFQFEKSKFVLHLYKLESPSLLWCSVPIKSGQNGSSGFAKHF